MSLLVSVASPVAFAQNQNQNLQPFYQTQSYQPAQSVQAAPTDTMQLRGGVSTIPTGTSLLVKMQQPLSSYSNNLGEPVSAQLENDVFVNNSITIPSGSEVLGQVTNVARSGRMGRHGELDVRFHSIRTPQGRVIPILGHIVTSDNTCILRGTSYKTDIAKGIGVAAGGTATGAAGGTAVGGLLGVVGTGAIVGTALGGIAGITYALARQGKDVVLPSGARLNVTVGQDVSVEN
jgi:hypothetical protein